MSRNRQFYEQLVSLAYEGLVGESIVDRIGLPKTSLNYCLTQIKLSLSEIRKARREGKPLTAILNNIDFGFIDDNAKKASDHGKKMAAARLAKLEKRTNGGGQNHDIQELLRLVREIHAEWCGSEPAHKPTWKLPVPPAAHQ